VDWTDVPAFAKLGLDAEVEVQEVEGIAEDIEEARALLT